jgi:hypothetical protein
MTVDPTVVSPVAPNTSASPDWENIAVEAKCPLCDYNLRGLSEPRCPECGYRFDWPSVLDADKRKHPYLFEHHPERNLWSYSQTLVQHLRPWRFWKTLEPTHRLKAIRIVRYWEIYAALALLAAAVGYVQVIRYRLQWSTRSGDALLDIFWETLRWQEVRLLAGGTLVLALFPWLNVITLMIFQQSMRRSGIKASHVMRCAIYSGDVVVWYALAAVIGAVWLGTHPRQSQTELFALLLTLGGLLAICLNGLRLWIAYARYMKFKHALATVLSSQIIVGLGLLAVLLYATES